MVTGRFQSQKMPAFAMPFGLYQFNRMPFGLNGAPATFQWLVDRVIRNPESVCRVYIDDLIIFSKSWDEHVSHIRAVLERLKGAGLTAKLAKYCFGTRSCTYLGHVVGSGVVHPEPSKVHAVLTFPILATKTHVRAFLGLMLGLLSALHPKLCITG